MQIPFIGGAYKGYSSDINAQECINLYPKVDRFEAKNVRALVGTPGMELFCNSGVTSQVRNMHVMGTTLYAVIGNTVYSIDSEGTATALSGTLTTSIGYVWMADNGTELFIVDPGVEGYLYDTDDSSPAVTAIADAHFPTPSSVTFQDGYFIITKDATGRFHISASYDGTSWDATEFSTAESNPDNLVACLADHGVLWLFGAESVEVWVDTGAADFPYERIQGVFIQEGLGARHSIAQLNNSLLWFTDKRRVVMTSGYSPQVISTPHLEYIFAGYSTVSDAIGFGYVQEGHAFYFLTFPTEGKSWCYDVTTGYWHQRQSYIAHTAGYWNKHRAHCYAFCYGKHLIGDFENGKIYEWKTDVYADDGETIRRLRRAQVIHQDQKQIFYNQFEIDFEGGLALDKYETLESVHDGGDTDAVTDWAEQSDDALNPVEETIIIKQGTKSMKLGVDASKSGDDYAWWNHAGPWDFGKYTQNYLHVWVFFETLDYLRTTGGAAFSIWLGNDASNVCKWDWEKTDLIQGWNLLELDLNNPTSEDGTVDYAALDYNWIGIRCVTGNTNDFSIYVDDMKVVKELSLDPQAMLRWSDDGGHTWSHEHWANIGPTGEYSKRAVWRRLGRSRNRIMEMSISDPVKVVMVSAHLDAEIGAT